jgi:hypothetical protein
MLQIPIEQQIGIELGDFVGNGQLRSLSLLMFPETPRSG